MRQPAAGIGPGGDWFRAHLSSGGTHYLVPDPDHHLWPDQDGTVDRWDCKTLLTMTDGEQVTSRVAVLPETFAALPSDLPRRRQRRLVHLARAIERDLGLWNRDHEDGCGPHSCGWIPPSPSPSAAVDPGDKSRTAQDAAETPPRRREPETRRRGA